ncbi:hypothetical protein D3C72_2256990 [compost metagenome]
MRITQFIQPVAGPDPNIFACTLCANTFYQRENIRHVLRMQRIAARKGNPLALYPRVVEVVNDAIRHLVGKRLA